MSEELLRQILIIVASILVLVFVIVGIEVIRTLRRVRKTVNDLGPTLARVNNALDTVEPALKRVDPLLERVSLTVDAVNLEIMRADQILADISEVTTVTSGTVRKVAGVTDAPLNLLTNATEKVRNIFVERKAVKSSKELLGGDTAEESELVVAPDPDQVPRATPAHEILASGGAVAASAFSYTPSDPFSQVAAAAASPRVEVPQAEVDPLAGFTVPDVAPTPSAVSPAIAANLYQSGLDIDNDLNVVEPEIDTIAAGILVDLPNAPVAVPSIDVAVPELSVAVPDINIDVPRTDRAVPSIEIDTDAAVAQAASYIPPRPTPASTYAPPTISVDATTGVVTQSSGTNELPDLVPSFDDELPSLDVDEPLTEPPFVLGFEPTTAVPEIDYSAAAPVSEIDYSVVASSPLESSYTAAAPVPDIDYSVVASVPEVGYGAAIPAPETSFGAAIPAPETSFGAAIPVSEIDLEALTQSLIPETMQEPFPAGAQVPNAFVTDTAVFAQPQAQPQPQPVPQPQPQQGVPEAVFESVYIPAPPRAGVGYAPPQTQAQQARAQEIAFTDASKVEGSDAFSR